MSENQIFDLMILGSGWTNDCGEIGGVFNKAPEGYRCLWSTKWMTQTGLLEPKTWMPPDKMTKSQMVYEGLDIAARQTGDYQAAKVMQLLIQYQSGTMDYGWQANMQRLLEGLRHNYEEFICPWWPPPANKIIWNVQHPYFKHWTGTPAKTTQEEPVIQQGSGYGEWP
jgi:hypothetical protein